MHLVDDFPRLLSQLRDPAAPALTFYRGRALVATVDYGELLRRVERAAATLQRLDVGAGDRVALLALNRIDVPVWLLALWQRGAVAVPLNPHAQREDWRHILAHSGARGLLVAHELADTVPTVGLHFLRSLDEGYEPGTTTTTPTTMRPPDDLADAPAIILYTSGTTGLPKGVVLSQRNLLSNGRAMAARFRLAQTTQLAVLPLYHAHALGFGLVSALTTGGHLVFTERFDPLAWAEIARNHAVAVASVTPNLLPLLLQARVHAVDLPSLRALLVSSAPLASELARSFEQETGLSLVHGWGLSEYTNFACCTDPFAPAGERAARLWGGEVPSVGTALDGTEVSVRDEAGEPRQPGERGELCVRGPCRMLSYFNDPLATAQTMSGDWLRTGDEGFARMHDSRPHFYITGRLKEIVIRSGEKHSPVAVENRLLVDLPELGGHLVVLGFPHRLHGEELGAYVELDPLPEAFSLRLMSAIERLPVELRPKVVLHGPEPIPRTHTGKVQRRRLQPWFARFGEVMGRPRLERLG